MGLYGKLWLHHLVFALCWCLSTIDRLRLCVCCYSAEKALLDECNLTVGDLQSLLMAHQDNRLVQQVFMEMQVKSARFHP